MKHQVIKSYGTFFDYPPRAIPDDKASFSNNVMFKEGWIKNRWGYDTFGSGLPLDGIVQGIFHYKKLSTGNDYIVAVTTTDTYRYDSPTSTWIRITRSYNTGTVTSSGAGNRTITLTGGAWGETTNVWTAQNSLNTARWGLAGCGTTSAALSFGGVDSTSSAVTEQFDGTNWTAKNSLNTARVGLAGCGTTSAALSFGGDAQAGRSAVTEQFDGTNWTAKNSLNTARRTIAGCGTTSAALSFGGYILASSAVTEQFDGTNWTAKNSLNTARCYLAGCGTTSAALSIGGLGGSVSAVTEQFDGTNWTAKNSLNTARYYLAGCGTTSAALSFGGHLGTISAITEKFGSKNLINFNINGTNNKAKIALGTNDINYSGTWNEIANFDGYAQLTLSLDISSVANVSYVIRLGHDATLDNIVSFAQPYDDSENDFILVFSNSKNNAIRWNGEGGETVLGNFELTGDTTNASADISATTSRLATGMYVYGSGIPTDAYISSITSDSVFVLSANATATATEIILTFFNMPDICKFIGFFGSVGYEHIAIANLKSSTGAEAKQKIAFSYAGEPEQWLDSNTDIYYELLNSNDAIMGIVPLQGRLYVYKEHSITEMWPDPNGGNTDPFNYTENKIQNIGTPTIRSVCSSGTFHIFFGWTDFYMFDGMNVRSIGEPVRNYFLENVTDEAKLRRSFAYLIEEESLYVFHVCTGANDYPDTAFVFNYVEQTWTKWTFAHTFTAEGKYRLNTDDTPVYLLGDEDGYIYKLAESYTTDARSSVATNIAATVTTKDFPLNDPKHTFRLLEAVIGLICKSTATTLSIRASVDMGVNWSTAVTIASTLGTDYYEEQIANFIERGRQVRFEITNVSGSPFIIESIDIGFNSLDDGVVK